MEDNMTVKPENDSEPVRGNWEFVFTVKDLTEDEADALLDEITAWVNKSHTSYGGGFFLSVDDEAEDEAEGGENGKE